MVFSSLLLQLVASMTYVCAQPSSVFPLLQSAQELDCERARTCASCVGMSGDCVWCSTPVSQQAIVMNPAH